MTTENMWIKTHKALNDFIQALTCKICERKLSNPQQFLNCGHYVCVECVGNKTDCPECQIPAKASHIYADTDINELLHNLNIIAEAVALLPEKHSQEFEVPKSPITIKSNESNVTKRRKIVRKTAQNKPIDDTLNTSICDSTISRSTFHIPKNINKKNKKGETALHIACRSGNEERVKMLLEAGANPNTKDNAGWTPLQEATSYGHQNICQNLLKSGANPNMYGYDNRTALHEAVILDDCDLASLLLNSNANREVFDKVGKKPKDYCKSKEMANLFKSLQDSENNKTALSSDKTMDADRTLNIFSDSKIVFYGSNLNQKNRKLLIKLGNEKKIKVVNNLSPSVTHVIVDTDSCDNITLSFDILLAILFGKWLLNSECLSIFLDNENITSSNFSLFEVNPPQLDDGPARARENLDKQNPKLFNNCYFYFAVKSTDTFKYDGVSFTKDHLMKLVAAGDGVILTREPRPEDIQGSLSPFHVADNPTHSLHKCTHYIIYVPDSNASHSHSSRLIYNMTTLKTLPIMWFIESILRYKLIDPIDIGLTPES